MNNVEGEFYAGENATWCLRLETGDWSAATEIP